MQVYYSPFCLKQIRNIIEGKICYIVPGKVDEYDYRISCVLSIPILCGDPQTLSSLQTKSGAKEIFNELEIPVPLGSSKGKITSKEVFYQELS